MVKNINYPQLNLDELYILPPNWPVPFAGEKIQCFNTFEAENDGCWSADKEVFCGFKLPQTKSIWKILLDYEPFVNKQNKKIKFTCYVNDSFICSQIITNKHKTSNMIFSVSNNILKDNEVVWLKFVIEGINSPKELGINSDCRKLGIKFKSIKIS